MFKVEFDTDNAAFCDAATGEPSEWDKFSETKRILTGVINDMMAGRNSGAVVDINGNKIGEWGFEEEKELER